MTEEEGPRFVEEPIPLALGSIKVTKLVCGAGHTLVMTANKQLFTWGCNLLGQLG
jgi:alpha-tubulin suppressor-like RCC1 family protein